MNWYNKIIISQTLTPMGLEGYLSSWGVSPDVSQFILSLPKETAQFYINKVRKQPNLTLLQLKSEQPPQKIDPYLPQEKNLAKQYETEFPNFSKWILVSLRKLRKGIIPPQGLSIDKALDENTLWGYLSLVRKVPEIRDWIRAYNPDIASFTPEQAIEMTDEWHRVMAGEGKGKMYAPTNPELIIYGPNWKDKKYNGWTIQKVISKNDLKTEGYKLNHCVGGYCSAVEHGSSIIYSLRDPKNEPHVTFETSANGEMRQAFGNSNEEPDSEYTPMIREWILEGKESPEKWETSDNTEEWYFDGDLSSLSNRLSELTNGYREDDSFDYENSEKANNYGLNYDYKNENFDAFLNNPSSENIIEKVFEAIEYDYDYSNENEFAGHEIVKNLVKYLNEQKRLMEQNNLKSDIKNEIIQILKEQLGSYPSMLSEDPQAAQSQKRFCQEVLRKISEPKDQTYLKFPEDETQSQWGRRNWYREYCSKKRVKI